MPALIAQLLPLALFIIMLGLGLSLTPDDFRRVLRYPRLVLWALFGQLLVLPLLAWAAVTLSGLDALLAAALLIVSLAPGGATSNLISHLCRADTALSVTLTALTSLITPFTLPLLATWILTLGVAETTAVSLPLLPTLAKLLSITLVPIALGMGLRRLNPALSRRLQPLVKIASLLFMAVAVTGLAVAHWDRINGLLNEVVPVVLGLVMVAMLAGALLASFAGGGSAQQVTVAVEVGIQNAGTALVVTGTLLNAPQMTAAVLIYGIFMQLPALLLVLYRNRRMLGTGRWRPAFQSPR